MCYEYRPECFNLKTWLVVYMESELKIAPKNMMKFIDSFLIWHRPLEM